MKELIYVFQLDPLKDIFMASMLVHLIGSHWDVRTEMHWDVQMELEMDLNLVLMKEPSFVLRLAPLKHIMMVTLTVLLIWSHWDEKTKLHSHLQMDIQMGMILGLMK